MDIQSVEYWTKLLQENPDEYVKLRSKYFKKVFAYLPETQQMKLNAKLEEINRYTLEGPHQIGKVLEGIRFILNELLNGPGGMNELYQKLKTTVDLIRMEAASKSIH